MIELKNLGKKYDRPIFSNLNLQFAENELVAFLGPSGSGKTTLLKIMAGLEAASEGHYSGLTGQKKSIVFQEPRLLHWLTCLENIHLFQPSEQKSKAISFAEKLGLHDAKDLFPASLSGGMKMRTAIARALMEDPQVLFLDEPFSALDEPTRFFLQEEFRKLFEQNGWSVFFVTHSIEEACFLANKIVVFGAEGGQAPTLHSVNLPKIRTADLRSDLNYFKVVNDLRAQVAKAWKKEALK